MTTPMRRQYLAIKKQFPDTILFFRLGDFYETFDGDAEIVARVCDVVLTSRPVGANERVPLAGVPYHSVEPHIAKLVNAGYKVAIAEQLGSEPPPGEKLVERVVRRVVTAGTIVEPGLLDEGRNNYLAAVAWDVGAGSGERRAIGLAYADITTGEFAATQLEGAEAERLLREELARLQPAELLLKETGKGRKEGKRGEEGDGSEAPSFPTFPSFPSSPSLSLTSLPAWQFEVETARRALLEQFEVESLAAFGVEGMPQAVRAAGALVQYLRQTQRGSLPHLTGLRTYSTGEFMTLDEATRRNLELTQTIRTGSKKGSLLEVLDATRTPMGARLLRQWLHQPLLDLERLQARLDGVQAWHDHLPARTELRELLRPIGDLERWTNRAAQGIARPQELVGIRQVLALAPELVRLVGELSIVNWQLSIVNCGDVLDLLRAAIADEPSTTLEKGGVIRKGFSAELDGIEVASRDARQWVAGLERVERERTGIKSLKVGFNKVFGYYIEVTTANAALVPADYIRKQTLVNAERYITPELKEYESLILNADERQLELERQIYQQVLEQIAAAAPRLLQLAQAIAELDVLAGLAEVAANNRYVRPTLAGDGVLEIAAGRHPVVERTLRDEVFQPNDVCLSPEEAILVITGPNMSGKCVSGETMVFTDSGLRPIKSMQPQGMEVDTFTPLACRVKGKQETVSTSHFYAGGHQPTRRIRTRLGYQIEATPEHRLWVRNSDGSEGWKPTEAIEPGDYLAIDRKVDLWGAQEELPKSSAREMKKSASLKLYPLPHRLSTDLAYMIGLLIGDGSLRERNAIFITSADESIGSEFGRIARDLFDYRVFRQVKLRYGISSRQIRQFFFELGLDYVTAHNKHLPDCILQAPKPVVRACLQGLFDTDGYADRKGNVSLSTSSATLAQQVQMLLLNFGMIASLHTKKSQRLINASYVVTLYGAEAARFYDAVGFRLERKQARRALVSELRMPNVGGIPYLEQSLKAIQERIVSTPDKPLALKHVKSINSIFYTYLPSGRNVSYFKLDELTRYCDDNGVPYPELHSLLDQRYFYDPVVEIEHGEAEVYDLTVPKTHAFVANGFVNHNSTYLRQNAIITLMAQIGSFVPAERAHIGLVDRIFTRIGAQDEIHAGQSTFMVEMVEAANILHHATSRSLIIFDELGRGTSTYDGLSIAWAVVEYIHNHPRLRAKTLFATHYHELTELAERLPHVINYNVAVAEQGDSVVFLHRIVPGAADKSYGIHVAQLAGLPRPVIHRAEEILADLEADGDSPTKLWPVSDRASEPAVVQLSLFGGTHPAVDALKKLDINALSPLEALNKLYELQKIAQK